MRGFFLLLALSNILFLGWQFWGETEAKRGNAANEATMDKGGLKLLSEIGDGAYPVERTHAAATKATSSIATSHAQADVISPAQVLADDVELDSESPGSTVVCYQSAPLDSLDEASRLQQRLTGMGIKEVKRIAVQSRRTNYWVILRAYENLDKANEAAALLKSSRIRDFFIVRSGQYENAISLGVFSTLERAKLRYEEIAALRAKVRLRKPQIEQLDLPAKQLILEFQLEDGRAPTELSTLLSDTASAVVKKIPCK